MGGWLVGIKQIFNEKLGRGSYTVINASVKSCEFCFCGKGDYRIK